MKATIKIPVYLLTAMLFGSIAAIPSIAMAGKDHHRHGHHYDRHDYGHNHSRHHHKHHKRHKHSHRKNYIVYNQSFVQPGGYYPQPAYVYAPSYNSNYYPNQPYGYPPNVSLGINTGNTSFMLRY